MTKELLEYFGGDELAASVWLGKYALKNEKGEVVEQTPHEMHIRMAKEFVRAEAKYPKATPQQLSKLSVFGAQLNEQEFDIDFLMKYLGRFKHIIPQGSIMSALGNPYKLQSLSNCFVIPSPYDSYGGIFKTDQETAQLEKRRGGVGLNINTLRPEDTVVANAAGTSTGAHSFMDRFSNTTREVAQNGRRGALMLLMSILHPDIIKFITKKKDRTKVTGANVSVQLTNTFMDAVGEGQDFICRYPIETDLSKYALPELEYNKLEEIDKNIFVMKINAKEIFDLIVEMAWDNAEPGIAFMDRVINYSPEGVYALLRAIASNPCGEQWMQAYDACRLLAANLFHLVVNPYRHGAYVDINLAYEVFYMQQRLADDIVDLEIEYINRIIDKIKQDPEPEDVKATELNLWINVRDTATKSRRTGCGFTAMADMIAALGLRYDDEAAINVVTLVMQTKMRAELDCTIDLAILRGSFEGWDRTLEFDAVAGTHIPPFQKKGFGMQSAANIQGWGVIGKNDFYKMLADEFPDQSKRMYQYGRRNINWSTVAPTGSVSIIALLNKYPNTSGGMEPVFMPYYFRNKKVNPSDKDVRIDFVDQNGDAWQTFPVLMGGFKEWIESTGKYYLGIHNDIDVNALTREQLEMMFNYSPYFSSCANDISWQQRIRIQGILQKYTTNAISSTLNLPKDVSKETVANIYLEAWKNGLKGVTIYRDGCRTGVLVSSIENTDGTEISFHDAPKRPKELEAELHVVTVKGQRYGVVIGLLKGKMYEVFAFQAEAHVKATRGIITKAKKGQYNFTSSEGLIIDNLQSASIHDDERLLTRLLSGMMRHGVNPKYIYEQIDKCELAVVHFGTAVKRVIKKYLSEKDLVEGQKCKDCGSTNIRLEEGCTKCMDCGSSKCG
jgi:ribonucleoside-diphosphate reductase alpha chain